VNNEQTGAGSLNAANSVTDLKILLAANTTAQQLPPGKLAGIAFV